MVRERFFPHTVGIEGGQTLSSGEPIRISSGTSRTALSAASHFLRLRRVKRLYPTYSISLADHFLLKVFPTKTEHFE
jgi:hypothetical protein